MNATHTATEARESGSRDLRRLMDDVERLIHDAASSGDSQIDAARERLARELGDIRTKIESLQQPAMGKLRETAHRADESVHHHPYAAMGASVAIGVALGVLLSRR
jgi:ElaB/YqjD/DUF883 family membrane-anchored ribosome-binding protein